jgi:Icc protein
MLKPLFSLLPLVLLTAALGNSSDAPPQKTVRIALVSDTHCNRDTEGDRPLYKARLEKVIAEVNAAKVDVVLIAGDLTEGGKREQFEDFKAQSKGFRSPVYVVPGNHDVGGKHLVDKPGGTTAERNTLYEAQLGPSHWAATIAGVRILGINASLLGSGLPGEATQWTFLEKALAKPSPEPTLLLTHYPLYLTSADEPSSEYWNVEPAPRARLLTLLEKGKVHAVLSGHLHRPLEIRQKNVLYTGTPPVSFGLPRGKQPQGWTLVTLPLPCTSGEVIHTKFHPLADDTPAEPATPKGTS